MYYMGTWTFRPRQTPLPPNLKPSNLNPNPRALSPKPQNNLSLGLSCQVSYSSEGFLEKNVDKPPDEALLISGSLRLEKGYPIIEPLREPSKEPLIPLRVEKGLRSICWGSVGSYSGSTGCTRSFWWFKCYQCYRVYCRLRV